MTAARTSRFLFAALAFAAAAAFAYEDLDVGFAPLGGVGVGGLGWPNYGDRSIYKAHGSWAPLMWGGRAEFLVDTEYFLLEGFALRRFRGEYMDVDGPPDVEGRDYAAVVGLRRYLGSARSRPTFNFELRWWHASVTGEAPPGDYRADRYFFGGGGGWGLYGEPVTFIMNAGVGYRALHLAPAGTTDHYLAFLFGPEFKITATSWLRFVAGAEVAADFYDFAATHDKKMDWRVELGPEVVIVRREED